MKKKNVFIAFTPYNIFLAYGLAIRYQEEFDHYLFVFPEFSQNHLFLDILTNNIPGPFYKIISYYQGYGFFQKLKKFFILRRSLKKLKIFFLENKIDNLYVFTDTKMESQIALRYLKKNSEAKCIYVEEGIAPYHTILNPNKYFSQYVRRVLYGVWPEYVSATGCSRWIDEIQLIFPHYINPKLKQKKVVPYPKEVILRLKNSNYFDEYYRSFKFDKKSLKKVKVFILVENSRISIDSVKYKKNICDLIIQLKKNNMSVALKYHPNEPKKNYLNIGGEDNICVIPQAFPCEFLYLDGFLDLKIIIGTITTSLLTARWILSDVLIITSIKMSRYPDEWMAKVFDQLDIKQANCFKDIKKFIFKG